MKDLIEEELFGFIDEFSNKHAARTRWRQPVVRYASASDPLFPELKRAVRPSHAMPQDLLPGARTVIAYFLPFAREIVTGNPKNRLASREWAVGYVETNRLIIELNERLASVLESGGYRAAKLPPTHNFDKE